MNYHRNQFIHRNKKISRDIDVTPFIMIWESELWMMANVSEKAGCIESGGDLFGFLSHAGRPIIAIATPPGPNAIFESAHFRQDIESMKKTANWLFNYFGMVYIGTFHSHHLLGINVPSPGDIRSNNIIAQKNGYEKTCQLILTFENLHDPNRNERSLKNNIEPKNSPSHFRTSLNRRSPCSTHYNRVIKSNLSKQIQIRINAFYYTDAQNGKPIRCSIKILPGISPFRHSQKHLKDIELGSQYTKCGKTNILYEEYTPPSRPVVEIPDTIKKQLVLISDDVLQNTQIKQEDIYLLISLPIPDTQSLLTIAYEIEEPYEAKSVFISKNGSNAGPHDYSDIILSERRHIDIVTIFHLAKEIIHNGDGQNKSIPADTNSKNEEIKDE